MRPGNNSGALSYSRQRHRASITNSSSSNESNSSHSNDSSISRSCSSDGSNACFCSVAMDSIHYCHAHSKFCRGILSLCNSPLNHKGVLVVSLYCFKESQVGFLKKNISCQTVNNCQLSLSGCSLKCWTSDRLKDVCGDILYREPVKMEKTGD